MAQSGHITTEKSRWLKAVLGLGYTKEGLAPFCHDIAEIQHKAILDEIKKKPNILNKKCPRKHDNCCYLSYVSGESCSIYDIIKGYYTSSNKPNLKNTEPEDWMKDPWSIAKCFIYTSGYKEKKSAADTDITGLLHVIINNTFFHNYVSCTVDKSDIFSKVRDHRNEIFHSSARALKEQETNKYIDDMIAVLQDGKELKKQPDAKEAVEKLQDLKREDFVITTENYEKVLGEIREDLSSIRETTKGQAEVNENLKQIVASHESKIFELIQLIKDLHDDFSKNFDTSKEDLQKKLLNEYRDFCIDMPIMPCQQDHVCSFEDVYVTPRITIKSKDKDSKKHIETEVKKMSEVFLKDGKPLESIYVVGEAGSGKSSFCKSLMYCWCMAHSDGQQAKYYTEFHVDLIKVMKKFNFLFFLYLRDFTHFTNNETINDMLKKDYEHRVLEDLIERESETCLIVLDGLDEWTRTRNFPPPAKLSNYTVLTTSRPWKIASLGISDNKMKQSIYIRGFDDASRMEMITNTLKILQKKFPNKKKGTDECEKVLSKNPFYSMTHTAMMLQQLICLWFDGNLYETSRSNLYKNMLDLSFVWYQQKYPQSLEKRFEKSNDLKLNEICNDTKKIKSLIIKNISRLAYETLIKNEKETSLTFDSSMFKKLNISQDIKDCCLELGILSEEKGPSLCASSSRKSYISFIHKSVQEYLAAKHIVFNIHNGQESNIDTENADVSEKLSQMLNVKTLDELVEQENVLTMLCGMDTIVAKSVSKFIYNTIAKSDRFEKYRKTIDRYDIRNVFFIAHIQTFILDCAEETKANDKLLQFSFDLGDLVFFDGFQNNLSIIGEIEQHITLESVMSFYLHIIEKGKYDSRILACMTKCKNLETIKLNLQFDEEVHQHICDSIEANASTLKCLSLSFHTSGIYATSVSTSLFRHSANMTQLVALKLEGLTVTHEDFSSLCTCLSDTGYLQQISINIKCKCEKEHEVNLSKHKQLQYLKYCETVVVTNAVWANLEVIECPPLNQINCIKVLDFLRNSMKIKEFILESRINSLGQSDHYTTVTSKLTHVISLSQQLRKFTLNRFTFTDKIITCPSNMMCLESIDISLGIMSLTTWRRFVDSVAELPQPVKVKAFAICITRDGKECNPDIDRWRGGGGEEAAALQYVRKCDALFELSYEDEKSGSILFSTKK